MKRSLHIILLFLFSNPLVFVACLESGSGSKKITALAGKIEVTVPSQWQEIPDMHRSADLQAGDEKNNQYLLIVSERKKDTHFSSKEKYSKFTRTALIKRLGECFVFGPENIEINHYPALRYQIRGRSPHKNSVIYYHTVVETPRYFHQIVIWTSEKNFKGNQAGMVKITESFREN